MKMCQAFANNGHTVTLIVPNRTDSMESDVEDIYEYYDVDKIFQVRYISWLKIRGSGYVYSYFAARVAKQYEPDLVYGRNLIGCFFAVHNRLQVVFESHSPILDENSISAYFFRSLIRNCKFKRLVVITDVLKEHYKKHFPHFADSILIAPDAADEISDNIEPVVLPNKGKRMQVGYVGHLYPGRGVDIIIGLSMCCPWADFHLVGGNENDISFWKEKSLDQINIFFHGFVSPKDAVCFRLAFDVCLAPYQKIVTVSGHQGNTVAWMSPLKVFEYMAAKKPIILSNLPVFNGIFTDGEDVLLAYPESVNSWEMNLKKIRDDNVLSKKIAGNAYALFKQKYTWFVRAQNVIKNIC
jgi:glycosyltransferase involved in cell wall biosynthesis